MLPPLAEPAVDASLRLDDSAGLDAPARAHLDYVLRGDQAIVLEQRLAGLPGRDVGEPVGDRPDLARLRRCRS